MSADTEAGFDEDRQLCDDGNCLGVIVDGTCNVCGLVAAAATSPRDPTSGQTGNAVSSPRDPTSGQTGGARAAGGDDDAFDDDRQLCSDGNCTGLIGDHGKCKVCGRPASENAAS